MEPRERVVRARIELAAEAGERWQRRSEERSASIRRLSADGVIGADTPERRNAFIARERSHRGGLRMPIRTERMIGPTLDWTDDPPDPDARRTGSAVACILEIAASATPAAAGFGTGFLVAPDMLLTNHHVLPSAADCTGIGAEFGYEYENGRLRRGSIFELDPASFFYSDERLDFALVALSRTPLDAAGAAVRPLPLPLLGAIGKILIGHPIAIIQHPRGGPKKYATAENKLLDVLPDGFLHYSTDTLQGSSGSPAFNQWWEVVGLHHSSVPLMKDGRIMAQNGDVWDPETMSDEQVAWIANEAVRVSAIVAALSAESFPPAQQRLVDAVLSASRSSVERTDAPPSALATIETAETTGDQNVGNIVINISGPVTMHVTATSHPAARPAPAGDLPDIARIAAPEKKIRFDRNYKKRRGYDRSFLGVDVPLPSVAPERTDEMLKDVNGDVRVLKYHHFSLAMNSHRRLQMWSAVNVDYSPEMKSRRSRDEFGDDTWIADPRIAGDLQIDDDAFYKPATRMDRGHIVRRDDNAWGETELEIEYANSDTFHWTNCTPQHEAFNRENRNGIWGRLESHIKNSAAAAGNRLTIFSGPILDDENDPSVDYGYGSVQYPLRFWKVIVTADEDQHLHTYGFILDQSAAVDRFGIEAMDFRRFKRHQVDLRTITEESGVVFDDVLHQTDVMAGRPRAELKEVADVQLR